MDVKPLIHTNSLTERQLLAPRAHNSPRNSGTVPGVAVDPASAEERVRRIVELKESRGWSWARVAREIGVANSTVEAWVYRKINPSDQHRRRLAEVFEVSIEYIERGQEGEPAVNEVSQLAKRLDSLEAAIERLADLSRFARSNGERIANLEQASTRVETELGVLRELMEGTATAVKALRTGGVAPPQPAAAASPPPETRATAGRRRTAAPKSPER